jgi:hypothetical protein
MEVAHQNAPWWWKPVGLAFIAGGIAMVPIPGWIGATAIWENLLFVGSAGVLVFLGVVFLKTAPQPGTVCCPACGSDSKRSRLTYYCAQCGTALNPDEDELARSEINCPCCEEPIPKGIPVCPKCSKTLPGFGITYVKGQASCRWCNTRVEAGQKYCSWCSAPLAEKK